jgi:flagellar motor protein MotB
MASSHNHWTSVADLMSGFVVVVLVLFAVATTLPLFKPPPPPPPAAPRTDPLRVREQRRERFLGSLEDALAPYAREGILSLDRRTRSIQFNEVSFAVGSACLTEQAVLATDAVVLLIVAQLEADPELTIHVEGHTDPRPVNGLKNACGWFADNTQLSTLRAANVRARIADLVRFETRARLPVTGWGADRPRNLADRYAAENRRVELAFVWSTATSGAPTSPR